ncbi:MAG: hypothetical protein ABSD73_11790 [Candidatus Bathyarchaeia archaeon]
MNAHFQHWQRNRNRGRKHLARAVFYILLQIDREQLCCFQTFYFRAPENLFNPMLRSSFTVNMSGALDKTKKKIKPGAEKTEAEAKKAGGELKKAGIKAGEEVKHAGKKSAYEVKRVGHKTKEKLRPKKS